MKIAIFGRNFNPDFKSYIVEFFQNIKRHKVESVIYKPFLEFLKDDAGCDPMEEGYFTNVDNAPEDVDFMISIGGDGTFLESIMYLKDFNIPVIGLNSGRLGFLANISKEEITEAVTSIIQGDFELETRSLLTVETIANAFGHFNFALNDATVQKYNSVMINVNAYLDDEFLNTYWTDGLIISTPTGSTAYSLSAGGPIVIPGSENFLIAPIASHNLTVRPIVIPDNIEIKLEVQSRSNKFLLTVDNRTSLMDLKDSSVIIKKAKFELNMVKLPFNSYYSTIRNKLMWGADKRN
ncbi:MAG: NAD kinase [Bacteroidales bacterium]|nr:NAD kinase [Bacteroidales bacterium]